MAVTDKVVQIGPSGSRVIPDANVAEVGAGIVSTSGDLSVDAAGAKVVVNDAQANKDFLVKGTVSAKLLVVDADGNAVGLNVAIPSSILDIAGALTVQGAAAPAVSPAGTGRVYYDSGSNRFRVSENGNAFGDMLIGGGTAGHITFWSGTGSLSGEGNLFWDSGNDYLGVGGPSPAHSIDVVTGEIAAADGLVSAPSLTFGLDTDSGFYRAGANDFRAVSNGTDRVLVQSTGVTLQGPVEEIAAGSGTTLLVRMKNDGGGVDEKRWAFSFDSAVNTNALRIITENDALSSSVEMLSIDRSGNVALGSTTANAKLDVRGGAIFNEDAAAVNVRIEGSSEANLFVTNGTTDRVGIGTATPPARVAALVADGAVNGTRGFRVDNAAGDQILLEVGNASDSYVGTLSASAFSLRSNNIARITANSTGELVVNEGGLDYDTRFEGLSEANLLFLDASTDRAGFGTATPAGRVEIRDDSGINLVLTKVGAGVGTNDLMEFRTDLFTSGERHLFKWTTNSGALNVGRIGMEFDGASNTIDFVFRDMFDTAATTVEVMRLKGNGNLGLGVTDAASQLDMNGAFSVRASSAPALSPATQGRIYFDSISNKWKISENGGAYQDLLAAGSIGGSGTAAQIAFFTGATTIASDSDLYWDSTNNRMSLASGASPNTTLDMTGALSVRGIAAPALSPSGEGRLYFDSGASKWKISENGGAYQNLLDAAGVTGSGVAGQLSVWSGTSVLTGDTQLYWDTVNDYLGVDKALPTSTLDVGGSVAKAITTISVSSTLDDTHYTVLVDATAGNVVLTLPVASTASGREYRAKKIDSSSNTVSFARAGSDTIDGGTATVPMGAQYQAEVVQSNGSDWFVF